MFPTIKIYILLEKRLKSLKIIIGLYKSNIILFSGITLILFAKYLTSFTHICQLCFCYFNF